MVSTEAIEKILRRFHQGLTPVSLLALGGTTKVVPFSKAIDEMA
jgi:hypothetical protein